jgi:hypothetical protein
VTVGRISKKSADEQRTPVFLDESGFYPLPAAVRTYAPIGKTPVLHEYATRDHLSAIGAITPAGKLYMHVQRASFNHVAVAQCLMLAVAKIRGIPATIFGEEFRRQIPAKQDGDERAVRPVRPRRSHAPAARLRVPREAAFFAARSLASLRR